MFKLIGTAFGAGGLIMGSCGGGGAPPVVSYEQILTTGGDHPCSTWPSRLTPSWLGCFRAINCDGRVNAVVENGVIVRYTSCNTAG